MSRPKIGEPRMRRLDMWIDQDLLAQVNRVSKNEFLSTSATIRKLIRLGLKEVNK